MRRIHRSLLCLALGVVSACIPDEITVTEDIPTAGVRFINAVPDTTQMDFRFYDIVENNAHFRISFRGSPVSLGAGVAQVTSSTKIQYKPARVTAAPRKFRIFVNDTLLNVASIVLKDSTITLVAGRNYTVILWGYAHPTGLNRPAAAPTMKLSIFDDSAVPTTGNVGLRVVNATMNAIQGKTYRWVTGTVQATAVGAATPFTVAAMDTSALISVAPDTTLFNIQPSGGGTNLFADQRALVGLAEITTGAGPIDAVPGTTIAGSVVTAFVFPGSVPCTTAPQANTFQFTTGFVRTLSGTATGYARSSGSFVTEGFAVGQTVGACGFSTAANNGLSTVTAVTATALTVTKTGGTAVEAVTTGTTGATATLTATTAGYARSAGDFVLDGFVVGMVVTASGFTQPINNGPSLVTAVTPTLLTVTKLPAQTMVEGGTTGATSLSADTTGGNGHSRAAGSFTTDGFLVGHTITATGFTNGANNGSSTITKVEDTKITVSKAGGVVVEAAGAGRTLTTTNTRTILINRMISAQKPAISFVWSRRPTRTIP